MPQNPISWCTIGTNLANDGGHIVNMLTGPKCSSREGLRRASKNLETGHIWKVSISTYHKVFEALWAFQPLLNINLLQMHSVKNNFKQLLIPINSYNSYCCFHFHKVNTTVHKSHLAKTRFRLSDLEIQYEQHFTQLKQQRRTKGKRFPANSLLWAMRQVPCSPVSPASGCPGLQPVPCTHSEISRLQYSATMLSSGANCLSALRLLL